MKLTVMLTAKTDAQKDGHGVDGIRKGKSCEARKAERSQVCLRHADLSFALFLIPGACSRL